MQDARVNGVGVQDCFVWILLELSSHSGPFLACPKVCAQRRATNFSRHVHLRLWAYLLLEMTAGSDASSSLRLLPDE